MTLREDILRLSKGGKLDYTEDFMKAYLSDKLVFGEDTADIYAAVYGELMNEDYDDLFESIDDDFNGTLLTEAGGMPQAAADALAKYKYKDVVKGMDDAGIDKILKGRSSGLGAGTSSVMPTSTSPMIHGTNDTINKVSSAWIKNMKDQTLLGKIGNFFKGIKDGLMSGKVFDALKNGLGWIISPKGLPIVASTAAGVGVIVAIVNALRKKGKAKQADQLQAALDAAKKKETK